MLNKFNNKIFKTSISLRKKILEISQKVSAIHIGGSFSSAEIIATIFNQLKKKKKINLFYQRVIQAFYYIVCWPN